MPDTTLKQMESATLTMQTDRLQQRLKGVHNATTHQGRGEDADLKVASQQFESLLLNYMIREMRATIPESGLFPRSMTEDIFTSMLDEQYGDRLAQGGGIGLARMIVEQMGAKSSPEPASDSASNPSEKLK
jgi:peptidoglycan hydrolase FlgJ